MSFRLVCHECVRRLRTEIKSIGILEHPDVRCAHCGVYIRSSTTDSPGSGDRWWPITDEQLAELHTREMEEDPDDRLHFSFALDEGEEDLGKAQDEICREKTVRCKVYECDPDSMKKVHVVQLYLNDDTPHPIFAGTIWRHDRFPSNFDIALALTRWREHLGAPEFIIERYEGVLRTPDDWVRLP